MQVFFILVIFDHGCNETFTCADLRLVLCESMKENGVIFDEYEITQLVQVLMDESLAEGRKCQELNYKDMKNLLDQGNGLATALALRYHHLMTYSYFQAALYSRYFSFFPVWIICSFPQLLWQRDMSLCPSASHPAMRGITRPTSDF